MFQNLLTNKQSEKIVFSIIIPFFNEEKNVSFVIEGLIQSLKYKNFSYEIITVNNGSFDSTASVLEEYSSYYDFIKIVNVDKNRGFGWGIRQGIQAAKGEWICFFGGDGQTHPIDVVRMLKISQTQKDICIFTGFRILRNDGIFRNIISKVFNSMFRFLFKIQLRDINGTPKVIRGDFIRRTKLSTEGWFIDAEITLRAKARNLKILEYPVIFRKRNSGKTHINIFAILEFIQKMLFYYFNRRSLLE